MAPFRESVIGTSLTNIVYQKQLVTAQSTSNLVDETLGKRMSELCEKRNKLDDDSSIWHVRSN